MFKSYTPYITYVVLSVLVIIFAKYINEVVTFMVAFYNTIDSHLEIFFSKTEAGDICRSSIALVVSPLVLTGVPAAIYYAIKRSKMPYFLAAIWLAWLIIVLSNLLK
ncbi:MAG: hypothetical protein P1U74_05535 [Legionellaceae bacterium]|nr:hypothetical protein [Legionellaceae bacterium]